VCLKTVAELHLTLFGNMFFVISADTAQMISPGCSFKFAGLNDVLTLIKQSTKVPPVEKLARNYRMTKSVLEVGNALLRVLKENFPSQIEYGTTRWSTDSTVRIFRLYFADIIFIRL
jgi:hypothetical protein